MWKALDAHGRLVDAAPGLEAVCPGCRATVIPKCGEIIEWHFAHASGLDCGYRASEESDWHFDWKAKFPQDWREVTDAPHRAVVRTPHGLTIEFQASQIGTDDVKAREKHYGRMEWVFRACDAFAEGRLRLRQPYPATDKRLFEWDRPRRFPESVVRPCALDLGNGSLLWVREVSGSASRTEGWGRLMSVDAFLALRLAHGAA